MKHWWLFILLVFAACEEKKATTIPLYQAHGCLWQPNCINVKSI